MRVSYWSNSKFSKWVRNKFGASERPTAATIEGWDVFHKESKEKAPFVHWFTDDFLDDLQDVVYWPKDKLDDMSYWFYNRFVSPTHLIKTGLTKGKYHETEEKILHGVFAELVDFVEIQKASMNYRCDDKKKPFSKMFLPYFIHKVLPFRSQQLGVDYLLWEITLKKDDEWFGYSWRDDKEQVEIDKANNPEYMKPTPQAAAAQRILDAYVWWKFIRPMRPDPMDASGYTDYFDSLEKNGISLFSSKTKESEESKQLGKKCSDQCTEIEKQYFDEDTYYLKEIIEIRASLWT